MTLKNNQIYLNHGCLKGEYSLLMYLRTVVKNLIIDQLTVFFTVPSASTLDFMKVEPILTANILGIPIDRHSKCFCTLFPNVFENISITSTLFC